ncbi:MAG: formamidopyrimidine-DNA glycosylase [Armatimonadetes bacterium]|nr:formamidopyrimidine-DNA glycosylase [Armatimonadota bacterium]
MPELPDIELYISSLKDRIIGSSLDTSKVISFSILKTVDPPMGLFLGQRVVDISRLGKRIVLHFPDELYLVIHLMVSGRFRWHEPGKTPKPVRKFDHLFLEFSTGTLTLHEFSMKKRASLHAIRHRYALSSHDPGGVEPLEASFDDVRISLTRENRTIKRALTTPQWISGIGNAYSDEILHAARLSPLKQTQKMTDEEWDRLLPAIPATLIQWRDKLLQEFQGRFPGPSDITAFRPDFAAHGKFGKPCPCCGKPIQHIVYAENECNYCAVCQNNGAILADRALSRLLKDEFPRGFDEMEEQMSEKPHG